MMMAYPLAREPVQFKISKDGISTHMISEAKQKIFQHSKRSDFLEKRLRLNRD